VHTSLQAPVPPPHPTRNSTSTIAMAINQLGIIPVIPVDPYPDQAEPHSSMMPYHPYHGGQNPNHDYNSQTLVYLKSPQGVYDENRKNLFYASVQQWLIGELTKIGFPVVIAIAPGSQANPYPYGFMHEIVDGIKHPFYAGKMTLCRNITVPKSADNPGPRSKATHVGTISRIDVINPQTNLPVPHVFYQDKVVLILDDVWTSGSTLCACKDVVKEVPPMKIVLCAIGRTVQLLTTPSLLSPNLFLNFFVETFS